MVVRVKIKRKGPINWHKNDTKIQFMDLIQGDRFGKQLSHILDMALSFGQGNTVGQVGKLRKKERIFYNDCAGRIDRTRRRSDDIVAASIR